MGMVSRHPKTIILTHQDDLPQILGHHPDLTHESATGEAPLQICEALFRQRTVKIWDSSPTHAGHGKITTACILNDGILNSGQKVKCKTMESDFPIIAPACLAVLKGGGHSPKEGPKEREPKKGDHIH